MSTRHRDLLIGSGTALLFTYILFVVIPGQIQVPGNLPMAAMSPAFWPSVVAWLAIGLGLILAVKALLSIAAAPEPAGSNPPTPIWRSMLAIALMFAYYAAIKALGIVLASVLALAALAWLFGERRRGVLLLTALLLPIGLYYFFTKIASIPLPMGAFDSLF
jgi:putative tricarboxylic transport membrane protein